MDGGMICPRVPDAHIKPDESRALYPALVMTGRLIKPIVTTVAPTIPVDAANRAPTIITEIPRPPALLPNSFPIASSNLKAMFDFSSMTPINTNRGTATKVSAFMTPKILSG